MPQFPRWPFWERRPSDVARRAGPGRPPGGASAGRAPERWARGQRSLAPPRPRGPRRQRRKPEREAGRRADSHGTDPPAASRGGGDSGPGTGGCNCLPRRGTAGRRKAGQRPGQAGAGRGPGGGRAGSGGRGPGPRAEGTRTPRDAPRRAARLGLYRPFPSGGAALRSVGQEPARDSGAPRAPSHSCSPRELEGWSEQCERGLFKRCQAQGSFSAPPCHSGNEAKF